MSQILHKSDQRVLSLRCHQDIAVAAQVDGQLLLIDGMRTISSGLPRIYAIDFHPSSPHLLIGGQGSLRILDMPSGALIKEIALPCEWAQSVSWTPDGQFVLVAGNREKLYCFEVASGRKVGEVEAGERNAGIAISGQTFICPCSWQGGSRLQWGRWDGELSWLSSPRVKRESDELGGCAFINGAVVFSDGDLQIYSSGGERVQAFEESGDKVEEDDQINGSWSDPTVSGGRLAAGSPSGQIHVFDCATWNRSATLGGHQGAVLAVRFWRNGLISAGEDLTIRYWEL